MANILLVGERPELIQVLARILHSDGHEVAKVTDPCELDPALRDINVDLVIFDHVEPLDLYMLNPREAGYEGPILLLSESGPVAFDVLQANAFLPKSFFLTELRRMVLDLLPEQACAQVASEFSAQEVNEMAGIEFFALVLGLLFVAGALYIYFDRQERARMREEQPLTVLLAEEVIEMRNRFW